MSALKVAFIILAHEGPERIVRLVKHLVDADGTVVIHFDLKTRAEPFNITKKALDRYGDKVLWAERVNVGWGQWSMIEATANALIALRARGGHFDYVTLLSGDDYPIRPLDQFEAFLSRNTGKEFLELSNMNEQTWIVDGLFHERYRYRHYLNWKSHPKLFRFSHQLQQRLGLKRKFPVGYTPHMGSQWWTLTWETCEKVLDAALNPVLRRFFKTVWIPDEMFVQTVVARECRPEVISNNPLALYQFTDYGVPLIFYDDHTGYLTRQPFFFARKISPDANRLRDELDEANAGTRPVRSFQDFQIGKRTREYEAFRLAHRNGLFGTRVVGQVKDPFYGDLEWNEIPYFVILGASSEELSYIRDHLQRAKDVTCHGELFARRWIQFKDNADRYAGYRRDDVALRDVSRTNFLVDVLHETPGQTSGFCLRYDQGENILGQCQWDMNARIVLIKGNPLRSYVEKSLGKGRKIRANLSETHIPPLFAEEGMIPHYEFLEYCRDIKQYFDKYRKELLHMVDKVHVLDLSSAQKAARENWAPQLARFMELECFDADYEIASLPSVESRVKNFDDLRRLSLSRGIHL